MRNLIALPLFIFLASISTAAANSFFHPASISPAAISHGDVRSGDSGYWVIVGSVPTSNLPEWERSGREVLRKVANCGLVSFNDYSHFFTDFTPGYNVFVIGPYRTLGDAEETRDVARHCIHDAYIKKGSYFPY